MKAKNLDRKKFLIPLVLTAVFFSLSLLSACAGGAPASAPVESPQPPEPEPVPAQEPVPEEPAAETPVPDEDNSVYVMPEDVYEETRKDLNKLVQELNEIIAKKDYQSWLSYLTDEYRAYFSDPEVLRTQSESPLLKKYNIVLRSLQDYFHYVVVGSRQNVRLDEIKALDENRVRAYMYINESPVIIYELQRTDGRWKIGIIE
jgi:hypothetical protein